jgi:hypothetical protein
MFIARVSRGRTVREFLISVLIVPSLACVLWMTVFGGTAISQVMHDGYEAAAKADLPLQLFAMLDALPLAQITSFLGIVLVVVFFVTSSDSGSLVIDVIAAGGKVDAPTPQRVFWCTLRRPGGDRADSRRRPGGAAGDGGVDRAARSRSCCWCRRCVDQGPGCPSPAPALKRGASRRTSQVEQLEILDFLRPSPFDELPDEALQRVASAVDVRYYKAGQRIVEFGDPAQYWHVLRSGAVEVFRRNGTLYNRLTAGGYFGEFGLLRASGSAFPAWRSKTACCT